MTSLKTSTGVPGQSVVGSQENYTGGGRGEGRQGCRTLSLAMPNCDGIPPSGAAGRVYASLIHDTPTRACDLPGEAT